MKWTLENFDVFYLKKKKTSNYFSKHGSFKSRRMQLCKLEPSEKFQLRLILVLPNGKKLKKKKRFICPEEPRFYEKEIKVSHADEVLCVNKYYEKKYILGEIELYNLSRE